MPSKMMVASFLILQWFHAHFLPFFLLSLFVAATRTSARHLEQLFVLLSVEQILSVVHHLIDAPLVS